MIEGIEAAPEIPPCAQDPKENTQKKTRTHRHKKHTHKCQVVKSMRGKKPTGGTTKKNQFISANGSNSEARGVWPELKAVSVKSQHLRRPGILLCLRLGRLRCFETWGFRGLGFRGGVGGGGGGRWVGRGVGGGWGGGGGWGRWVGELGGGGGEVGWFSWCGGGEVGWFVGQGLWRFPLETPRTSARPPFIELALDRVDGSTKSHFDLQFTQAVAKA